MLNSRDIDTRFGKNRDEGILELVRGIFQDARAMLNKEFLAVKLEIKEDFAQILKASISLAIGIFILAVGVIFLTLMLVFLLVEYTSLVLWSSLGIVGLAYLVLGAVVVIAGKKAMSSTNPLPDDALRGAKADMRYITKKASGQ
jgi:Putative Actinobacterial Holin-X, holin superfamily III